MASNSHDSPYNSHRDSAYIAGWQLRPNDDWHNVEAGAKLPNDDEVVRADSIVIRVETTEGDIRYYTIHGGITDDYPLDEIIDDLGTSYGEEYV